MSRIFILTHRSTWQNIFHFPLNNLIKFTEHQAGVAAEWLLTCKRRPKMNGFLKAAHGILVFLLILIKNSSGKKREKESYEKIIFCFLAKD